MYGKKGEREGPGNTVPTIISKSRPLCVQVQTKSWPPLNPLLSIWSICNLGAHADGADGPQEYVDNMAWWKERRGEAVAVDLCHCCPLTGCFIKNIPFLQRVSIACYAEHCISHSKSVRPSVCPSVTRWH